MDETGKGREADNYYSWSPIGEPTKIERNGIKGNVSIIGATELTKTFETYNLCFNGVNGDVVQYFIEKLLQNHPNKTIYLLLDNSKMHTCNKVQQTFRKYKHRIYPIYFPKYAPDLNPQENIWRYVKGRLVRGNAYGFNDELIDDIGMITDYLNSNPDRVQTITKVSSYF